MPTGTPADATLGSPGTRRGLERQNEAAAILAAAGYLVEQMPSRRQGDTYSPNKEPDLRVGENIFDVYSPITGDLDGIRDGVSAKKNQASRIVINLADTAATPAQVRDVLIRKPVSGLSEVLAIDQQS